MLKKIISWNMHGASGSFKTHERAWEWLTRNSDVDICLLQEVIPNEEHLRSWSSHVFSAKRELPRWGTMILVRDGQLQKFEPTLHTPWLKRFECSSPVARHDASDLILCSVHSSYSAVDVKNDELPKDLLRATSAKIWEIELIAYDFKSIFADQLFIFGGDLNSSIQIDENRGYGNNRKLFENLKDYGFLDTRLPFYNNEQPTYFKGGEKPFQLDHIFSDEKTSKQIRSWEVFPEIVAEEKLSDHAPIVIEVETT